MKRIVMIIMATTLIGSAAQAQIRTYTSNAEDSMACIQNLSLYIEYFKQGNYNDALMGWRNAAQICPKSTESLWINGIKIYQEMVDKIEDPAKKELYTDTMFWAYDQRIEHFGKKDGKEGFILGRKGSDLMKYRKDDPKQAYDVLLKSLELQGNDMEAGASIFLYKSAYDLYRNKQVEKSVLFDLYSALSAPIEHNLANQTQDAMINAYKSAQENIDKMFSSVAECPDLVEIYTPKFEANPGDEALLKIILKNFDKRNCTDEALYQKAAVALYAISPSPTAAYAIANSYAKKNEYSKALEYFTNAYEQAEDADLKVKAISQAAKTCLLMGNYIKAKSLSQELLRLNPKNGEAYILIGDAYAKGKGDCGSNECEGRAAYWAAVDKYYQAKSVDPSVAEQAQSRINTYSAQFPKKEDCFFHGINEGTSYTFSCWIGETTTVRTRDN